MRVRMSWEWVGDYPIFVYTTFLEHNRFHVKLVKGTKGNQNAGGTGPQAAPWHEYIETRFASKDEVVVAALEMAEKLLKDEGGEEDERSCN